MKLFDLPLEVLVSLPSYLRNIEDFNNLRSTCQTFRNIFSHTSPNIILRLYNDSAPSFCHPHPHFLIAATAKELSCWSLATQLNKRRFLQAIRGGIDVLKDLCVEICGLTLQDIRKLHLARFSALNPVSDILDACAGPTWCRTPNFWDGGVSEPATLQTDPVRATMQILIYGELFAADMKSFFLPHEMLPRHDIEDRLEFIRYCIPDVMCKIAYDGMEKPANTGPYALESTNMHPMDQVNLQYILNCSTWKKRWAAVRAQIGQDFQEDFDEAWKQDMWGSYVEMSGLEGFRLFSGGIVDETRKLRMKKSRELIANLRQVEDRPCEMIFGLGRNTTWAFPRMATDVYVLMCGYWPQPQLLP